MSKFMCENIKQWNLWIIIIVVCSMTQQALTMGMEEFGDKPIRSRIKWNQDLTDLVNFPGRVYRKEVNGDERFYWKSDEVAFNVFLKRFSIVVGGGELVILPAPGTVRTFRRKELRRKELEICWKLHVPGGFYLTEAMSESETTVYSKHPVLTVYVGGEKGLDLKKLEVPETLHVLTLEDLLQRYLQGLESPSASVRKWAAHRLSTVVPIAEYAILPLIKHLKDPKAEVRRQVAATLGTFGMRAYAALPALRNTMKTDKSVKKLAKVAVEKIEQAENVESQKKRDIAKQIRASKIIKSKAHKKPTTQETSKH